MRPKEASARAVRRLFQRKPVVDLDSLYRALKTRSRMTVFRYLKDLDYLSSYSHAGRYYTLPDIPRFDENGLWFYQGIGFSKAGTLKNTALGLIDAADAGRTCPELKQLLLVRVQNTLLDLVGEARIGRERIERVYLYVSGEPGRAAVQIARRRDLLRTERERRPLTAATIIEVLVEIIQVARARVAPEEIVKRLTARGIAVTAQQVDEVFLLYGLDPKKRAK